VPPVIVPLQVNFDELESQTTESCGVPLAFAAGTTNAAHATVAAPITIARSNMRTKLLFAQGNHNHGTKSGK
jgi:hypothetical protein